VVLGWYSRDELLPIHNEAIEMFWHEVDEAEQV
jgi:hypothetical protein